MNRILLTAACGLLAPAVFAQTTVTVNSAGGGDFTSLQAAIESFCDGGANAAASAPFTIDVVPQATPYDEVLALNDAWNCLTVTGSQELQGALTVQSASPGTLAWVAVQEGPQAGDGFLVYQANNDVSFIDIQFTPSVAAAAPGDDLIKVDENAFNQPSAMNTTTFQNCVVSDIVSPGTPLISNAADWMAIVSTNAVPAVGPTAWGASGSGTIKCWGDAGESATYVLDNIVSMNLGHSLQIVPENNEESAYVTDLLSASYLQWNSPLYMGCGDGPSGESVLAGTDVHDAATSTILYSRGWHTCNVYKSDTKSFEVSDVRAYGPSDTASHSRGFSMAGAGAGANFTDCIIVTNYYDMMVRSGHDMTLDRVTLGTIEADDQIINQYLADSGGITMTDCILSGPGNAFGGTAVFPNGILLNNCGLVQSGPNALASITSTGSAVTATATVTEDPVFLNTTDVTSNDFYAVDSQWYATAASGGGPLSGGGNYVGGTVPVELSIFTSN